MITESQIAAAHRAELETTPIALEMATISEWIASRPEEDPDSFFSMIVEPLDDRGELKIFCDCSRGAVDEVCPEAVALIDKFRELDSPLLIQLHRRRPARTIDETLDRYLPERIRKIEGLIQQRKEDLRFVGRVPNDPE